MASRLRFPEPEQVVIDTLRISVGTQLSQYPMLVRNMTVDTRLSHVTDTVCFQFSSLLANIQKLDETKTTLYYYPATPLEYLKEKYSPAWVLKRWPVRYDSKEIPTSVKRHYLCPHMELGDDYPHIAWLIRDQSR